MSPIEYIEAGIKDGNWHVICEGYERLTGKSLPVPDICDATQALDMIRAIVSTNANKPCIPSPDGQPIRKKRGRPKGRKKKTTVTNEGEDSSLQFNDNHKTIVQKETDGIRLITNNPDLEEVEKNRLKAEKANRNKLQLNRKVAKTYKVKCNECEETFESTRPRGEMGQKCNKCLGDKKNRFI